MDTIKFKGVLFLWLGSLITIILSFLIIHYKIQPTTESLPLHYNVLLGVDLLGEGTVLYCIPFISLGIVLVNFLIGNFVHSPSRFLYFLSALVSFAIGLFSLIGVLFLLRIT